jgi:two-component system response regulator
MHEQSAVLLVDDSELDTFLIHRAFQKAGINNPLRVFSSSEEAISHLIGNLAYPNPTQHPLPGLLLMDLKMRGLHGLELLGWLRSRPGLEGLVVVVLTSFGSPSDIAEAYRLGANCCLFKPTDFELLIQICKGVHRYWLNNINSIDTRTTLFPAHISVGGISPGAAPGPPA